MKAPGFAVLDILGGVVVLASVVLILHHIILVAPLTTVPPVAEVAIAGPLEALAVSILVLHLHIVINSTAICGVLAHIRPGDLALVGLALLDLLLSDPPCLAVLVVAGFCLTHGVATLKLPCIPAAT